MLTDPRVFDEAYVPRRLEHRDAAVQVLTQAFQPVVTGHDGGDVLLSGPSGVGKTALVRFLLDRLERETTAPAVRVRCLGTTTGDVLRALLEAHPDSGTPAGNTPVEQLVDDLRALERPMIVVLDEGDGLPEMAVLEHLVDQDALSLVPIVHDADAWLARLDTTARRRIRGGEHLRLQRFSTPELADILETRAEQGLRAGAVERGQLERIADDAAGVARRGIQTLRAAAELATEREHGTIREEDLEDAPERARRRIRRSNLASLPIHHHVLYELVREAGAIDATALHDRYDAVAERVYRGRERTPISKRARRNKLAKLQEYDLLVGEGEAGDRQYRVVDGELASEVVDVGLEHVE